MRLYATDARARKIAKIVDAQGNSVWGVRYVSEELGMIIRFEEREQGGLIRYGAGALQVIEFGSFTIVMKEEA